VFAQPQVQYLGFVLSEKGVAASSEKVKAVQNFPTPACVKEVRSFLGLTSFYRRLVPKFAEIAKPLTSLTGKDQPITRGSKSARSIQEAEGKTFYNSCLNFPGL
jgi:hypothetical protein